MRKVSGISLLLSLVFFLSACCNDSSVREAVYQGLYEGGKQVQQMENPEAIKPSPTLEKPETYGQYKREREAAMESEDISAPLEIHDASE